MRTRLPTFAGVFAVAMASMTPAASAHRSDSLSFLACAAKRSNPDHVIDHSHPLAIGNGWAWYYCESHDIDTRCKYTVILVEGGILGPFGSSCRQIPLL